MIVNLIVILSLSTLACVFKEPTFELADDDFVSTQYVSCYFASMFLLSINTSRRMSWLRWSRVWMYAQTNQGQVLVEANLVVFFLNIMPSSSS